MHPARLAGEVLKQHVSAERLIVLVGAPEGAGEVTVEIDRQVPLVSSGLSPRRTRSNRSTSAMSS